MKNKKDIPISNFKHLNSHAGYKNVLIISLLVSVRIFRNKLPGWDSGRSKPNWNEIQPIRVEWQQPRQIRRRCPFAPSPATPPPRADI